MTKLKCPILIFFHRDIQKSFLILKFSKKYTPRGWDNPESLWMNVKQIGELSQESCSPTNYPFPPEFRSFQEFKYKHKLSTYTQDKNNYVEDKI